MAGTERLLQHECGVRFEGVSGAKRKKRRNVSRNKSLLSPSEQIRRGRYEQQRDDIDVYASLLQIQEEISSTSRAGRSNDTDDEDDQPYETLFDQLEDLSKTVECLRAIPKPMQEKITFLKLAQQFESKNINQLSNIDNWKYKFHKWRLKSVQLLHSLVKILTPWGSLIAKTEHCLGSGVASYFVFLRWLLGFNLLLFLLVLGFVILPQGLVGEGLEAPDELTQAEGTSKFSYLLDGKGYLMEYSLLFYGYYDNKTIEIDDGVGVYNLPLAFMLTAGATLIISFILISRKIMSKSVVVFAAQQSLPFSWLVLSSWDHNIGDAIVARHRKSTILDSLKKASKEDEVSETTRKWHLFSIRALVNVFVVFLLAASVTAVYFTVSSATCLLLATSGVDLTVYFKGGPDAFVQFFSVLRVPLVVSGLNLIIPAVFDGIAQLNWEQLHPRKRLLLTLGRSYVLYLANFIVLLVTLLTHLKPSESNIDDISCCVDTASDAFPQLLNFPNCARLAMGIVSDEELAHVSNLCWKNITTMSDIVTSFPCLKMIGPDREDLSRCWETVIGQELFQLLIIDILIEIFVSIFVLEWIRALLVYTGGCRCCKKFATWMGNATFHTSDNVLVLIYQQAIVWLGFFFCPFLPGIALIGMLIIFFLRILSTQVAIKPQQVFREIRHNIRRYYMLALLGMLIIDFFTVGYIIVERTPSAECGPFRNLPFMSDILVRSIETWPSWVEAVINFFKSVVVVSILILLICLLGYHQWHTAKAYKEFQKDLLYQMNVLTKNFNKLQSQRYAASVAPTLRSPTSLLSLIAPTTLQHPEVLPSNSDVKQRNRRDQKKQPMLNVPRPDHGHMVESNLMTRQPRLKTSNEVKRKEVKPREVKKKKPSPQRPPSVAISEEASKPAQEFEYFNSGFDELYATADICQEQQPHWPNNNRGHSRKILKRVFPLPAISQSNSHVQVPSFLLGTQDDPYQDDYNQPPGYWITLEDAV